MQIDQLYTILRQNLLNLWILAYKKYYNMQHKKDQIYFSRTTVLTIPLVFQFAQNHHHFSQNVLRKILRIIIFDLRDLRKICTFFQKTLTLFYARICWILNFWHIKGATICSMRKVRYIFSRWTVLKIPFHFQFAQNHRHFSQNVLRIITFDYFA